MTDYTLLFTDMKAGAGIMFLGYIQRLALGQVKALDRDQFPHRNCWDRVPGAGFEYRKNWRTRPESTLQISGSNVSRIDEWPRTIGRDQQQYIGTRWDGSRGAEIYHHWYPRDLNDYFTDIERVCTIVGTEQNHREWLQLKNIKTGRHNASAEINYKYDLKINERYPATTTLDYNKFFRTVERQEVQKFLINTLDSYTNDGLNDSIEMIKIYTELNDQLLKEWYE